MKRLFIILFFVISVSYFAQGKYLQKGENGVGIGVGFATNNDFSGFGGGASYSVSGIFDFGIGISRLNFDQQLLGEDINATIISSSISFYPLKQNDDIPFSISLDAGYDWQLYSNDVLDDNNVDVTGRFFNIGVSIYGRIPASSSFNIQPILGFKYVTGEVEIEGGNNVSFESDDDRTLFIVGVDLVFNTGNTNKFVLVPRVVVDDSNTTVGLGALFVFN